MKNKLKFVWKYKWRFAIGYLVLALAGHFNPPPTSPESSVVVPAEEPSQPAAEILAIPAHTEWEDPAQLPKPSAKESARYYAEARALERRLHLEKVGRCKDGTATAQDLEYCHFILQLEGELK
jgi:hypothetical protein